MARMEKSEILKIIGQNVKRIRHDKGLTQVDLVGKIKAQIDTTNIYEKEEPMRQFIHYLESVRL